MFAFIIFALVTTIQPSSNNGTTQINNIELTCSHLDYVEEISTVSSTSTYGTGLLTAIVTSFIEILGIENDLYSNKVKRAENKALLYIMRKAQKCGATGIMNYHVQVSGKTVYMYGTAYKLPNDHENEESEDY